MERKRKIKDGHIVVENPLFQELPTHEVTIKSGRTLYRFTGSYDDSADLNRAIAVCDAYYGDGSSVVQLCEEAGKLVMIQDVGVLNNLSVNE